MKTTSKPAGFHSPKTLVLHGRRGAVGVLRRSVLLLLAIPLAAQAQFNYATDNGTITITGYNCTAGAATIPSTIDGLPVTIVRYSAFSGCTGLTSVYFQGEVPTDEEGVFDGAEGVTVYYLAGTTGWGATYAGRPTAIWSAPLILSSGPGFGVSADGFGFLISWAPNASVVVEAGTDLANPVWTPVSTNTLTGGTSQFRDPQWTNYPARLYRLHTP